MQRFVVASLGAALLAGRASCLVLVPRAQEVAGVPASSSWGPVLSLTDVISLARVQKSRAAERAAAPVWAQAQAQMEPTKSENKKLALSQVRAAASIDPTLHVPLGKQAAANDGTGVAAVVSNIDAAEAATAEEEKMKTEAAKPEQAQDQTELAATARESWTKAEAQTELATKARQNRTKAEAKAEKGKPPPCREACEVARNQAVKGKAAEAAKPLQVQATLEAMSNMFRAGAGAATPEAQAQPEAAKANKAEPAPCSEACELTKAQAVKDKGAKEAANPVQAEAEAAKAKQARLALAQASGSARVVSGFGGTKASRAEAETANVQPGTATVALTPWSKRAGRRRDAKKTCRETDAARARRHAAVLSREEDGAEDEERREDADEEDEAHDDHDEGEREADEEDEGDHKADEEGDAEDEDEHEDDEGKDEDDEDEEHAE